MIFWMSVVNGECHDSQVLSRSLTLLLRAKISCSSFLPFITQHQTQSNAILGKSQQISMRNQQIPLSEAKNLCNKSPNGNST